MLVSEYGEEWVDVIDDSDIGPRKVLISAVVCEFEQPGIIKKRNTDINKINYIIINCFKKLPGTRVTYTYNNKKF